MKVESPADLPESAPQAVVQAVQTAAAAGLVYVTDTDSGIRRVRRGKGFKYLAKENKEITAGKELQRIVSLAIPPAYKDVWICPDPRGHLQATARDARGRKQYRYHPEWRGVRDCAKFDRMIEFGAALGKLRKRLKQDLALPGLPREKVLAAVVSLLDATRVRIGNTEYAKSNNSFGLSTLRDRHVKFIPNGRAVLRFRGKAGLEHEIIIDDARIARIMRGCQELPGQQLFQYVDDEGSRHPIDSGQVNAYLREAMGAEFTAKDFRTWGATLRAILLLACMPLPRKSKTEKRLQRQLNRCIANVVKEVAQELRNTAAVCRKSYINPVVFESWRDGVLHATVGSNAKRVSPRKAERLALKLLRRLS